jgi:hypothetical protein
MNFLFSLHWYLVAAAWYTINGILHDIFIIRAHKGPYDRDLLRLLMDGHVLIVSGLISLVCWFMVKAGIIYGPVTGMIIAGGMVVYCIMIFPFLKSIVTLALSLMLFTACIFQFLNLK